MNGGGGARNQQSDQSKQNQDKNRQRAIVTISELLAEPDSMGEQLTRPPNGFVCTKVALSQGTRLRITI